MKSLFRTLGALCLLMMTSCYNHNVTREVRMNSGGLEEVEAALMSSGRFVRAETSVYGGSKHLTAELHPATEFNSLTIEVFGIWVPSLVTTGGSCN